MNNEPVAWMNSKGDIILPAMQANKEYNIPLYAHPVKETLDTRSYLMGRYDTSPVELTDDEILSVIKCIADDVSPHKEYENTYADGWLDACNTVYDEVFAILRKAQEK